MVFYILNGRETETFNFRRVYNASLCMKVEKEYRRIVETSKTIRIVGFHPIEEPGPQPQHYQRIPARFTATSSVRSWTFTRLQADGKCKAYFDHDCELPKNYWGSISPE